MAKWQNSNAIQKCLSIFSESGGGGGGGVVDVNRKITCRKFLKKKNDSRRMKGQILTATSQSLCVCVWVKITISKSAYFPKIAYAHSVRVSVHALANHWPDVVLISQINLNQYHKVILPKSTKVSKDYESMQYQGYTLHVMLVLPVSFFLDVKPSFFLLPSFSKFDIRWSCTRERAVSNRKK